MVRRWPIDGSFVTSNSHGKGVEIGQGCQICVGKWRLERRRRVATLFFVCYPEWRKGDLARTGGKKSYTPGRIGYCFEDITQCTSVMGERADLSTGALTTCAIGLSCLQPRSLLNHSITMLFLIVQTFHETEILSFTTSFALKIAHSILSALAHRGLGFWRPDRWYLSLRSLTAYPLISVVGGRRSKPVWPDARANTDTLSFEGLKRRFQKGESGSWKKGFRVSFFGVFFFFHTIFNLL